MGITAVCSADRHRKQNLVATAPEIGSLLNLPVYADV